MSTWQWHAEIIDAHIRRPTCKKFEDQSTQQINDFQLPRNLCIRRWPTSLSIQTTAEVSWKIPGLITGGYLSLPLRTAQRGFKPGWVQNFLFCWKMEEHPKLKLRANN
jgi:hypothetical protein